MSNDDDLRVWIRAEHVHVGQRIRRGPWSGTVTEIHWLAPTLGCDPSRWLTLHVQRDDRPFRETCGPMRAEDAVLVTEDSRTCSCKRTAEHCAAGERFYIRELAAPTDERIAAATAAIHDFDRSFE